MREVSSGTVPRSDFVQAVGVFCKLRAPPIKLSLHSWTLSNPLVSRIIPLSGTCNNPLKKIELSITQHEVVGRMAIIMNGDPGINCTASFGGELI